MTHPLDLLTDSERRIVGSALDCLLGSYSPKWERILQRHYRRPGGRDAAAARRLLARLSPCRPLIAPEPRTAPPADLVLSPAERRVLWHCLVACDLGPEDQARALAVAERLYAPAPVPIRETMQGTG
jgi:hypothetical protein